ncbi:DUF1997 domain-containing protein [Romeriopsis navalis]|nr:DUF1997 domain-containing protein [Romeriopsis navalis]
MSDAYSPDEGVTANARRTEDGKTIFRINFVDSMEMYAEPQVVADYLDVHPEWFTRCAHPLKTEPLGENGYVLIVGRYGNFGYEIEPKVGLHLLPQDHGVYRIETLPVPDYIPAGYDIDFKASMELVESSNQPANRELSLPTMTQVQWNLDLDVFVQFPKFIQALPHSLVEKTGDALLENVVKQISRRLTRKVQEDFHTSRNLPMPKSQKRWPF